jgi:hypothetical protein
MRKYWWVIGLLIALTLAVMSPLASPHPDGLERVAENQGFIDKAQEPFYNIVPDYVFPGISNEATATIAAGLVGTLLMFGLGLGMSKWLKSGSPADKSASR